MSANFVAVAPSTTGHLRLFNCLDELPTVSTVNYSPGVRSGEPDDRATRQGRLLRLLDGIGRPRRGRQRLLLRHGPRGGVQGGVSDQECTTRVSHPDGKLRAGVERRVKVIGAPGGAPSDASAAALNVTAVRAAEVGNLQVYPCGSTRSLETSAINYAANEVRPNTVVVGGDADGYVCLRSVRDVDVIIDFNGYFSDGAGLLFTPLNPIRLFDSRQGQGPINESTNGSQVRSGEVVRLSIAGRRGVPDDASAAFLNITVTQASTDLHVTAYPCGARPDVSNLNAHAGKTSANGAMVKLSPEGDVCIFARHDTHLIVDINGVWS